MMAPVMMEQPLQQQPQTIQHLVPSQKGINLSMLIDFLLQKTYHDLSVLSELLPRKPDIERKIEIIQFATKARQQFIRLLALVKWASSDDRVDKFQSISSCLDQQNAYFIDTADTLARIARETLVQARLPNFSLPTAVDVLTTGTFNRLPKCIKTRIVPDDPITSAEKASTLRLLNEVIQNRLVASKIPPQFSVVKIADGKLLLKVEHEFEVVLMLMGDGADIPWRLLHIEFLMEENETGDGRALVHGMQVHYIHQIVQSRFMVQANPLMDLYDTLHHFCLSLQLEVLHTQSKRLIAQRWGKFVKIEEYVSSDKLKLSFCRSSVSLTRPQQNEKSSSPTISILLSKEDKKALILKQTPNLNSDHKDIGGVYLSSSCLSIEKVFSFAIRMYALSQLKNLLSKLSASEAYFLQNTTLNEEIPCLQIKPFHGCLHDENVLITVDPRSGAFCIKKGDLIIKHLEAALRQDLEQFIIKFHSLRCSLFVEKCRKSVMLQPVFVHDKLPVINYDSSALSKLPSSRLYLQFKRYPEYFLVAAVSVKKEDPLKPLHDQYYLLQVQQASAEGQHASTSDEKSSLFEKCKADNLVQMNVSAILSANIEKKRYSNEQNQHVGASTSNDLKKRKYSLGNETKKNKKQKTSFNNKLTHTISEDSSDEEVINDVITRVVSISSQRIPFISICNQLMNSQFIFNPTSTSSETMDYSLLILDFPTLNGCDGNDVETFKKQIINCTLRLDSELNHWVLLYSFKKPSRLISSCAHVQHQCVEFDYNTVCLPGEKKESFVTDRILSDFEGLVKLYQHASKTDGYLKALKETCAVSTLKWMSYDMKSMMFSYSPEHSYDVKFGYSTMESKYTIRFSENGTSKDKCPHYLVEQKLAAEFNRHRNLHYILKIIETTYVPLKSITSIAILPSLLISNRVLSVVNNFTVISHSSNHVKIIYRNIYVLDIYLMETSVLIKDGTLYRTDATKAKRGFSSITHLTAFLQQFADKFSPGSVNSSGYDFPATPSGMEFDQQQNEHFSSSGHETPYKDRAMKSPAVVISSPQPYNQFTAPSPGNPPSVPSPGTFLQPSPAPLAAMSPGTWPGSPPLVQGSPAPGKQGASTASRLALSSINVTHAPVPVFLTHAGFKMLLAPKIGVEKSTKKPMLCPLERFFGSIQLRSHLLRVLRTDDTLKLEQCEHGIVIFSGTGKNGPENGLQYSVRLNPNTMDHLVLKATPSKGCDLSEDDVQILEHFFEYKVVCSPYKVCALTAFARILGAQPKIMKDFIRIMKLELQTNWKDFNYRVEWCLTIPPRDAPTIALPGTPAVVLKSKNLIFLQLTSLKDEENTVTITLVHDLKSNTVHHLEFPANARPNVKASSSIPPEPQRWAVRARAAVTNLLNRISDEIAKKSQPIYCAVFTILIKLQVPTATNLKV